ncbi:hypothetical protein Nepgr_032908 [Nepenthes gracilis]|uniref:Uncharacterized protein n=1 Tax=Nepenthes gracilis TaxID=150966 RepID=A0AAD3Y808_NEPGR|nr:hypothetical protein Nepgr_032908 [Nepenthes gracilis]
MVGSARAEAIGVHATIFHPDGRTLFCGYEGNLKGSSWEPTICHVAVDMGWSTYHFRNSIRVRVAKLSLMEPYGAGTTENNCPMELKLDPQENHATEKVVPAASCTPSSLSISPDFDIKEVKNIYVDYPKESSKLSTKRQSQTVAGPVNPTVQANVKSFIVPNIVPIESPAGRDLATVRRESLNPVKDDTIDSIKPSYLWRLVTDGGERELFEDKYPTVKTVEEQTERNFSLHIPTALDTVELKTLASAVVKLSLHIAKFENKLQVERDLALSGGSSMPLTGSGRRENNDGMKSPSRRGWLSGQASEISGAILMAYG